MEDKSSHVRRNVIRLLATLVQTHPFRAHDGFLALNEWQKRLEEVDTALDALKPVDAPELDPGNETVDTVLLDAPTQMDIDPPEGDQPSGDIPTASQQSNEDIPTTSQQSNEEGIQMLKLTRRYHLDAIAFIEIIHTASEAVCQLLSSRNKAEVIEAMDFFKIMDAYRIETAKVSFQRTNMLCILICGLSIGWYPQDASAHLDKGQ